MFYTSKKTFFLWEGVTYYLTEEAVKQTLKKAQSMLYLKLYPFLYKKVVLSNAI
ncbi:MAG: class I SAM-dependent methyltransferase [Promethearchaeota archaeon]